MDQTQNVAPASITAIASTLGPDLRKHRISALSKLREMREMFEAISTNGSSLPCSTIDEFYAAECDGRMIRFYSLVDRNFLITLEGEARSLAMQVPNLSFFCPRAKSEDEIAGHIRALFTQIDQMLDQGPVIPWIDHIYEDGHPEIESCELESVPGLSELVSRHHELAMAAMRRELPTTYNRISYNEGLGRKVVWTPSIALVDDVDGIDTLIGSDEDHWVSLFEQPRIDPDVALPVILAIDESKEGYLCLSRIQNINLCPVMRYQGTDAQLDKAYAELGSSNPSAPRTSIEAREYDLELETDCRDVEDEIDAFLASEADPIKLDTGIGPVTAPRNLSDLSTVLNDFMATAKDCDDDPYEALLSFPMNKRIEHFLALDVACEIYLRTTAGDNLEDIPLHSLLRPEGLDEDGYAIVVGELSTSMRERIAGGILGAAILDAYLEELGETPVGSVVSQFDPSIIDDFLANPASFVPKSFEEIIEGIQPVVTNALHSNKAPGESAIPTSTTELLKVSVALSMAEMVYQKVTFGMPIEAINIPDLFDLEAVQDFILGTLNPLAGEGMILSGVEASFLGYRMILDHLGFQDLAGVEPAGNA